MSGLVTTYDMLTTAAGLAALGTIIYAWAIEPYRIQLTKRDIEIPGLPESLDGLTICHLSDLHIGDFRRVERALARTLSNLEADFCAISGDLLYSAHGFSALGRVISHMKTVHGVYAVFGNAEHDRWTAGVPIAEELQKLGIRVLINRGERIRVNGSDVLVAGVDDPYLGFDDPESVLSHAPSASLSILLAHSPDVIRDLDEHLPDLILAGHTHGGQIRAPFLGALWHHSRHPGLGLSDGYYGQEELSAAAGRDMGDTSMYISRGIGGSGIRARFLCRPEVAMLRLRRPFSQNR